MARTVKPDEAELIQKEYWRLVAKKLGVKYIASYKDETLTVSDPKTSTQQHLHRWYLEHTGVIK